jgi:hypothetical protein
VIEFSFLWRFGFVKATNSCYKGMWKDRIKQRQKSLVLAGGSQVLSFHHALENVFPSNLAAIFISSMQITTRLVGHVRMARSLGRKCRNGCRSYLSLLLTNTLLSTAWKTGIPKTLLASMVRQSIIHANTNHIQSGFYVLLSPQGRFKTHSIYQY